MQYLPCSSAPHKRTVSQSNLVACAERDTDTALFAIAVPEEKGCLVTEEAEDDIAFLAGLC